MVKSKFELPPEGTGKMYYRAVESGGLFDGTRFRRFVALYRDTDQPVMVSEWALHMMEGHSQSLEDSLSRAIAKCPFPAVYFESKPVTPFAANTLPFEFVLVDTNYLKQFAEGRPDPRSFADHFDDCPEDAVACAFPNLGGDGILVAPKPPDVNENIPLRVYSHLAAFVREAPEADLTELWRVVGETYLEVLSNRKETKPVWFSTAGTGVAWLHFRFDDRPKYYKFQEFKEYEA